MNKLMFSWAAAVSLAFLAAPAASAAAPSDPVSLQLDRQHVEFVLAHHLALELDLARATHEVAYTPQGEPVSLIFDLDGISAFFTTPDGSVVHTLLKAHRAYLGLPEGVEIAVSLAHGTDAPMFEFHRVYGLMELGTLESDLREVAQDLRAPEWRETVFSLVKMVACAQLDKLPAVKAVPSFVSAWLVAKLTPACSQ